MKQCPICFSEYSDEHTTCPTDSARLMETKEWQPGQMVANKYRVIAKIGRGGMGAVYKAFHVGLEEIRALKVMDPQYARDPKFIVRFRHEAQVARRLRHPNAVHVDDLDQSDDGSLFIAMEFVDGVSLRQLLTATKGPIPLARALWITRCIADALGAAHALGMVHRDIKPDNILLARDASGRDIPKVLDFGIVAMREGSAIQSSRPLMTPAYAPPEQWQGMKASELDGRADLYALGMTLYEMLTGRLPFDAHSNEGWMRAHLEQIPLPPSTYNRELEGNADVDNLVLRMLAKDREMRPADANTLIQELSLVEAQHSWGKETIVRPLPPAAQRFPTPPRTPTPPPAFTPPPAPPLPPVREWVSPPPVPPVEKEEEIRMPRPSGPRFGAQNDRSGQGRGMKIALGVGVGLLALAGIVFLVIRMMSKQPPEIISFDADPKTVEAGKPVRLTWDLTHATKFRIEPQGGEFTAKADDVVVSGTTVTPRQDTTYILMASGPGGDKEARVKVSVKSGGTNRVILFHDDFHGEKNWQEGKSDTCATSYGSAGYSVKNISKGEECAVTPHGTIFLGANERLEVTQRLLGGKTDGDYGLKIGWQSAESKPQETFYTFGITADGSYQLFHYQHKVWKKLVDPANPKNPTDAAIKTGYGVDNRLAVEIRGRSISLYVNDKLLRKLEVSGVVQGRFGLYADQPQQEVIFSDLTVSHLGS
jgi:serine/threonine protein kinase